MQKEIFSIRNGNFLINNKLILHNLNFLLYEYDFISIIGPNGSGKTSLLNILGGLKKLSSGEIKYKNKPIQSYTKLQLAKEIAFVFQNEIIPFPFTVNEILLFGRMPKNNYKMMFSKDDYKYVNYLIEMFNLNEIKNKKIHELSGGEKKRVLIARALAQEPVCFLLDEPLNDLDLYYQFYILDILKDYQIKNKATIIMVTHDLNIAFKYSNKILILNEGTVSFYNSINEESIYTYLEKAFKINFEKVKSSSNELFILPRNK